MRALHPWALRHGASRTAALAAVLLCCALCLPSIAGAASAGTATGSASVSTGTWGATASPASLTFTSNGPQTVTVTNTGTVDLTALTYSVTVSGGFIFDSATVDACTVPWRGQRCPTGSTPVGTFATGTTTAASTTVPPLGGTVELLVRPSRANGRRPTTVAIDTTVSAPGQLRIPVATNQ